MTVIAEVTIPERRLNMTLAMRRNLDATLPASHTIDISFSLPPDSSTGGVSDSVGVMMKPDEEAPGQRLAGTRVKVRDGFFIFGLSALDIDVRHNMDVLQNRPWLGFPIRYQNGSRALLTIEKGDTGGKVLTEAFARWAATTGTSAQKK